MVVLLSCAAFGGSLAAQSSEQVATTLQFNYPLSRRAMGKLDVGGAAQVNGVGRWDKIGIQPAVDFRVARWADLLTQVQVDYVYQAANINTAEIRPAVGIRLYYVPTSRVVLRNRTLLEFRGLIYLVGDTSSTSWRLRDRIETRVAINHAAFDSNRLLYLIADLEGLLNPEHPPDERFLDRFILTIGLGFRFDYTWRGTGGSEHDPTRRSQERRECPPGSPDSLRALSSFLPGNKPAPRGAMPGTPSSIQRSGYFFSAIGGKSLNIFATALYRCLVFLSALSEIVA